MKATTLCYKCGVQFDADGDRHYVAGKPCCSDCYFNALGDLMEGEAMRVESPKIDQAIVECYLRWVAVGESDSEARQKTRDAFGSARVPDKIIDRALGVKRKPREAAKPDER